MLTLNDEGLVVDVWPAGKDDSTVGGPVASTYAFYHDAQEEEQ